MELGILPRMAEQLTDKQVRHVAKLARLRLSDDEVHPMAQQLSAILAYVAQIEELDTDGVEPMAHPLDVTNVLRDDTPGPTLTTDEALANAPARDGDFFAVPKVLGDGGGA